MNIVYVFGFGVYVCILKDVDSEVLDVGCIEMCIIYVDLIIFDILLFNFREDSR